MKNDDQLGAIRGLALALLGEVESLAEGEESASAARDGGDGDFYELIRAYEIFLIRRALLISRGNQSRAARMLRLKPSTLNHKIKQYEIDPDLKSLVRSAAADTCRTEPRPRSQATP